MAPSGGEHVEVSEPWRDHLVVYKLDHPEIVRLVVLEAWLRTGRRNDRIGDIGVYQVSDRDAQKIPDRVPEMMFEIVNPGRESRERDYIKNRAGYLDAGVLEYVVIDRFERRVAVFTRDQGRDTERIVQPGEVYTSDLLPGLAIPLDVVP